MARNLTRGTKGSSVADSDVELDFIFSVVYIYI